MYEIQRVELQNTNGMKLERIGRELKSKVLEVRTQMRQGSKKAN